jgi:acylphosphatase
MADNNYKRVKLAVTGDVQGVFFRHFAKREADRLGLAGWCRNESNGSIFIVVEGEEKNIDHFIRWAKKGSELSTVENVEVTEEKFTGLEQGFEIR